MEAFHAVHQVKPSKDIGKISTAWIILRWTPTGERKRDKPTGDQQIKK